MVPSANAKMVFENAHTYHINSLSINSDGKTFLSGDDLRINWWNIDDNERCFSKSITSLIYHHLTHTANTPSLMPLEALESSVSNLLPLPIRKSRHYQQTLST
jgi:hypothetical protein